MTVRRNAYENLKISFVLAQDLLVSLHDKKQGNVSKKSYSAFWQ